MKLTDINKPIIFIESLNIPIWTLLSSSILVFGFIGFYSMMAKLGIPSGIPDIKLVSGIGLISVFFLFLVYILTPTGDTYTARPAIYVFAIMQVLGTNFTVLAIFSIILFWMFSKVFWKGSDIDASELQSKQELSSTEKSKEHSSLLIIVIVFGALVSFSIVTKFLIIYAIIDETRFVIKNKAFSYFQLFVGVILVPIIVSYFFLSDGIKSMIGISKYNVEIVTNTNQAYSSILIYDNSDFFFLKENIDDSNVQVIPKKNVDKMTINELRPEQLRPKDGLLYFTYNFFISRKSKASNSELETQTPIIEDSSKIERTKPSFSSERINDNAFNSDMNEPDSLKVDDN